MFFFRKRSPSNSNYMTMSTQSQGDQRPQYDVLEVDQYDSTRYQTHNREHVAAARYANTKRETNFAELT